jgi:hypothetical protein
VAFSFGFDFLTMDWVAGQFENCQIQEGVIVRDFSPEGCCEHRYRVVHSSLTTED